MGSRARIGLNAIAVKEAVPVAIHCVDIFVSLGGFDNHGDQFGEVVAGDAEGNFLVNPDEEWLLESPLDLVVAGTAGSPAVLEAEKVAGGRCL